ncbi:winged helix-turn-helix domain-containing protein [Ferrimicrobium acidiphilum]|uniref:Helix-turn-helix domain protein n=2 Tax=Ferrimicrobium acidiphilum TaxID=121039 RepID=A0A0D8FQS2_9ACTN|nr:helix-turn-helix domain-containing protein [Ferrimicrobium acidiphilum]KJE75486.1 helix-turn-helix domain protein [Ferrimicrobium acidiphilum DSM 19497]MCL5054245.1 helix-turn-helix domain-containing protein [Gammaproteobacteria bacterium]
MASDTPPMNLETKRLIEAQAMRALTHPVRIALLEVLAVHQPLTATQAGELIQETATTCSFHLRQLAKYGFVEEAGRGKGRERPWKLVNIGFSIKEEDLDAEGRIAADVLMSVYFRRALERFDQWQRTHRSYPEELNRASAADQNALFVTTTELAEINAKVREILMTYRDRLVDPSLRPSDGRLIEVLYLAYPVDPGAAFTAKNLGSNEP